LTNSVINAYEVNVAFHFSHRDSEVNVSDYFHALNALKVVLLNCYSMGFAFRLGFYFGQVTVAK